MGRRLFVGNISYNTGEQQLEELFTAAGPVESVHVVRDQATGRARGFAFVDMESDSAAAAAIQKFNDTELDGRRLSVNEARPKPERSAGGGGGRGGGGGGGRRREPRW